MLGSNSKTVQYIEPNITIEPLFILADPRGNGTKEWFAVVTNNSRDQITAYAKSTGSAVSTYFTKNGTVVPFNNIVTTLMTDFSYIFIESDFESAFNKPISDWDTSKVTNMSQMFQDAKAFNQDISKWNVSKVTDMSFMFFGARAFNQNLSGWNTSSVKNMSHMFCGAWKFNSDISGWDTRNVEDMEKMFSGAEFNRNLSGWNVAKVTNMQGMFNGASIFNNGGSSGIGNWDTRNVEKMYAMFHGATLFNQDLSRWNVAKVTSANRGYFASPPLLLNPAFLPKWPLLSFNFLTNTIFLQEDSVPSSFPKFTQEDPRGTGTLEWFAVVDNSSSSRQRIIDYANSTGSAVSDYFKPSGESVPVDFNNIVTTLMTDMSFIFANTPNTPAPFNKDISRWDIKNVTIMYGMFLNNGEFNQNISKWDVANVIEMGLLFMNSDKFNQNISSWNVAKVTNMQGMFSNASIFNSNISGWNVAKVTDMSQMFRSATVFNQNISSWNVAKVTNMTEMFFQAMTFHQNLSGWNVAKVTSRNNFASPLLLINVVFQPNNWPLLSRLANGTIQYTGTQEAVTDAYNSLSKPLFVLEDPRGTGTPQWFAVVNDSSWGKIINYAGSYSDAISWFRPPGESSAVPFNNIVTTLMTNMDSLVSNATGFNEDISSWDTSRVTSMAYMFFATITFNQNISSWDTSKVTNMLSTFYAARAFNQNINGWNVANVTNMSHTFAYTDAFNQPLSSWNVAKVTDMSAMFQLAPAFNQNISAWNVSKVTNMNWMFNLAGKFNNGGSPDIGNWDTSNVTSVDAMFNGKNNQITLSHPFNQPIGTWNTSKVTNMNYMFRNALAFNQDLSGWNVSLVTPKPPTEFSINVTNNSSVLSAAYNPNWQNLRNFSNIGKLTTDPPFELTAPLSNSTGLFTYSSGNQSVATISGSTVTIVGAVGTATITATQAASGNFFSRTISATLTVSLS